MFEKQLQALATKRAALVADSQAILTAAGESDLTPEASEKLKANRDTLAAIKAKESEFEAIASESKTAPAVAREPDQWPGEQPKAANVRSAFEQDPKKGFASTQEFFKSVLTASQPGAQVRDDRLKFLATAGSDEMGGYANPYGGFLVPTGFMPNLLSIAAENDPTASLTTKVPMATPSITLPARTDTTHTSSVSGGLRVYRRSEAQSVTASRMTMEQVKLTVTPLMGFTYATEELIADSAISFVALIEAGFRDEFAAKMLYEKLHGTGAGEYEGVVNSGCLVTVSKETAQDADSIVYENVIKMRARCWGYQNAIWLYNHDCLPQLMQLVMTIGTSGVPMWQTSARDGEPDMLLGRPAYPTEFCQNIGDAGDIVLGNWSQYLEGTYQPLQTAESMHVRFDYNERAFRFTMRNDGRPWWRTYLTPKMSTETLSPFVILAERA
jgi:HK97 family phage major capsid protein